MKYLLSSLTTDVRLCTEKLTATKLTEFFFTSLAQHLLLPYSFERYGKGKEDIINMFQVYSNSYSEHFNINNIPSHRKLPKARQSITEAESSDRGNPLNSYFDFKIALFEKNNSKGKLSNIFFLTSTEINCNAYFVFSHHSDEKNE